jgi:G3E family GTPase
MMPVSVITGFLGSGKTTMLSHLLRQPAFADTAVIINEFGEIGLDHDLIETSDETTVTLQTGCLCCKMQDDLVRTLHDLLARRREGAVPPFARVVVETSGLADPAPILQSLMMDETAAANFPLARVVTVVDAVTGGGSLANHLEAQHQLAVADHVVVSKTDLSGGIPEDLTPFLQAAMAAGNVTTSDRGRVPAALLFAEGRADGGAMLDTVERLLSPGAKGDGAHQHHRHGHAGSEDAINTFVLLRDAPVAAVTLSLFLEALADHCGADLLRLKGLVQVREDPDHPAVIHGVQHVFHPPAWLPAWPSADRRTRMVFIARNIRESWVRALLEAIEAEVETAAREAT